MRPEFCVPNDLVFREGDIGKEMYFLTQGIMEVVGCVDTPKEEHYAVLHEGDFFGEIAVFHFVRRTASIRAISYSSTFVLTRRNLDLISDCESTPPTRRAARAHTLTDKSSAVVACPHAVYPTLAQHIRDKLSRHITSSAKQNGSEDTDPAKGTERTSYVLSASAKDSLVGRQPQSQSPHLGRFVEGKGRTDPPL
jgi:CRP-like cAMP-binding protein